MPIIKQKLPEPRLLQDEVQDKETRKLALWFASRLDAIKVVNRWFKK